MKVLLSLKPTYAQEILAGTKRFEFRRRIFRDRRTAVVVIYATQPIGMVVGEFKIKQIHVGHPDDLWLLASSHAGISQEKYHEYFRGRDEGYAIEVLEVIAYSRPQEISEILPSGRAPQSFAYIPRCQTANTTRRHPKRKSARMTAAKVDSSVIDFRAEVSS